jgi:hypothetical protein
MRLHWHVEEDGTLTALTGVGEYTISCLLLDREALIYHRARLHRWEREYAELVQALAERELDESTRVSVGQRLAELASWIEPPLFRRVRCSSRNLL